MNLRSWLAIGCIIAGFSPASAFYIAANGTTAHLTGGIDAGDKERFEAFLADPSNKSVKVLYLNSYGGRIDVAIEVARLIRKAKLDTAVRADSASCDSACTMLFAAGIRRYNVNGHRIFEGTTSMSGLGYHPARIRGQVARPSELSTDGTEKIAKFYAEMGQPRAIELVQRAAINTVYRPSGETSLAFKLATSLNEP